MTDNDAYGSTERSTEYEAQGKRGGRAGTARSLWAVAIAAIFVGAMFAWVALLQGQLSDPAPAGPSQSRIPLEGGGTEN
jgi:hypothetical protein